MRGRKVIPDGIKKQRGTLQKCRKRGSVNAILEDGVPDAPDDFTDLEKSIYYDTANELQRFGLLQKIGMSAILLYCTYISAAIDAENKIRQHGRVYKFVNKDGEAIPKVNPYHRISIECFASAKQIMSEFGITPSSQARLSTMIQGKKDDVSDFDLELSKF